MKKKPDQVVFNTLNEKYDASIKPYGTNVGAPKITTTDTTLWKNKNIEALNSTINVRYTELKLEFEKLMQEFEYNKLVYSARFNFEPLVGQLYHLYKNKEDETFLSIIKPEECNFKHLGSFRLNSDKIWEKVG